MAKRDRDTGIWKDPFYRSLPPLYKNFWDFLNDDCDNCGVWCVDWSWAKICIGKKVDPEIAQTLFAARIQVFDFGKKWHIKTFVSDKLGFVELNPSHKFQKSIIDLFNKHNIKPNKWYPDTLQSVMSMDKEEDKEKDKGKSAVDLILEIQKPDPEKLDAALADLDEALSDAERWTNDVIEGNDAYFINMVRGSGQILEGDLEEMARGHLGLIARYKWHEKIETQQAFRLSLLGHITKELKNKSNGSTAAKGTARTIGARVNGSDYSSGLQ